MQTDRQAGMQKGRQALGQAHVHGGYAIYLSLVTIRTCTIKSRCWVAIRPSSHLPHVRSHLVEFAPRFPPLRGTLLLHEVRTLWVVPSIHGVRVEHCAIRLQ